VGDRHEKLGEFNFRRLTTFRERTRSFGPRPYNAKRYEHIKCLFGLFVMLVSDWRVLEDDFTGTGLCGLV
jgi:hypothetical protein